ncbi:MAG TPA: hypothetical protein VML01_03000 [Bryobacterales bacterium]|nr:hypothetical protein [Bryobacterales bacterium]
MTFRVILIAPDAQLAERLREALGSDGANADATLVNVYPSEGQLKQIVDSKPDPVTAFIVSLADQERALSLIRSLRSTYSDSLAVAASVSSSADTILAAMRAGASEFLVPPFEVAHLKNTLEKQKKAITGAAAGPVVNGRLMCFLPAQGGNGASTLATHLSAAIASIVRKQVLLIDYDFHCGTVAFRLRLKPDFTFADAVERIADIDELWERLTSKGGGVDVLSAPPTGAIIPGEAFRHVAAIFTSARRTYPYVLVDFPSALHASCRDVLGLANSVYLISTPEVVSLHLARRRVNELIHLGLSNSDIHLILNRVGSKKTLNVDDVAEVVGIPVFSSLPNDYGAVSDASLKGGLIPNDTRLGREITNLAVRIVGADAPADKGQQDKGGKKWKGFLNFSS